MQTKLNNTNNPEWQEAHRINQKNKPRRALKNFDTEIVKKISDKKSTKKDQTPLCIATSKEGICFISSKKSG